LKGSEAAFHEFRSLSMPTLIMRPAGQGVQLHQENLGPAASSRWGGWLGLWARQRQRQRAVLRDLADDPHRLLDLGLTRQQALDEANKPFWR
jgi:uncharacterized protein YjiS (DUF1127 family)